MSTTTTTRRRASGATTNTTAKRTTQGQPYADGTVLTDATSGQAYVVERGGHRRPLRNVNDVLSLADDPSSLPRKTVSPERLAGVPLAVAHANLVGSKPVDGHDTFLGAGHYMHTWGAVDLATGRIAMQTRTRTITMFGGFHGSTSIIFGDVNDAPVYQTSDHRYGVDGTWIGRSDRTDAWFESMSPAAAAAMTSATVAYSWSPDSFEVILGKWKAGAKSIADLITAASGVATFVKAIL